jgi:hypothetical protein
MTYLYFLFIAMSDFTFQAMPFEGVEGEELRVTPAEKVEWPSIKRVIVFQRVDCKVEVFVTRRLPVVIILDFPFSTLKLFFFLKKVNLLMRLMGG